METNAPNDIPWYVGDFENIWHDNHGNTYILNFDYETFLNILSSKNLNVKSEYFVWKVIHDWVNFDRDNRLTHFEDLIHNCLRFGHLDEHFINNFIFKCELFKKLSETVQTKLKNFINNVLHTSKQTTIYKFSLPNLNYAIHFCPRIKLLVCIDKTYGITEFYNNRSNSWHSTKTKLNLNPFLKNYQMEHLDSETNLLYTFGGANFNFNSTNEVKSRSLNSSLYWTGKNPLGEYRHSFSSVVFNNTIYALGGVYRSFFKYSNPWILSSCERYDSRLNRWSFVTSMNVSRYNAAAAVLGNYIYIAGGTVSNSSVARSVERYDPQLDTWSEVAPMGTARSAFALNAFAGRLWATGGWDGKKELSTVESYDPVSNSWQSEAPLREARFGHSAIDYYGELFVVGGCTNGYILMKSVQLTEKFVSSVGWVNSGKLQSGIIDSKLIIAYSSDIPRLLSGTYY